jgi:hypothetical protein
MQNEKENEYSSQNEGKLQRSGYLNFCPKRILARESAEDQSDLGLGLCG